MYIQDLKLLGVFISDVRASGFRASGGLEPSKNASDGRAGGPRLGLDTSLLCTQQHHSIKERERQGAFTFYVVRQEGTNRATVYYYY